MIMLLLAAVLLVAQTGPFDWDALRLPRAVVIEGTRSQPNNPEVFKKALRLTPDWTYAEQFRAEGSAGFVLVDSRLLGSGPVFSYDARQQRGRRSGPGFEPELGVAITQSDLSPIGYVQLARRLAEQGAKIQEHDEGALKVCTLPMRAPDTRSLVIVVDPAAGRVLEVRMFGNETYRYLDWESLPDGTQHPRRVESEVALGGATYRSTSTIAKLTLLNPDTRAPVVSFPAEATIVDEIDHVVRDGRGNVIGTPDEFNGVRPGLGIRALVAAVTVRRAMIAVGAAFLALAGFLWLRRRLAAAG